MGNDLRERGFAHAWWSPEDERTDMTAVDHTSQDSSLTHKMLLPNVFVQRPGTHPFCQWFHIFSCLYR